MGPIFFSLSFSEKISILIFAVTLCCNVYGTIIENASASDTQHSPSLTTCKKTTLFKDKDHDGLGDWRKPLTLCQNDTPPLGYVPNSLDRNDHDAQHDERSSENDNCLTIIDATNPDELQKALNTALPGTMIHVHSGIYVGDFEISVSGTQENPITIEGPEDRSAILDGNFNVREWRGILTIASQRHITIQNLEIRNSGPRTYGVLIGAKNKSTDGSRHIELNNLLVHHSGEEIIKIQGRNTRHILVQNCTVHSNQNWSGIDVQGTWAPAPYEQRTRYVVIRNNLIYNIQTLGSKGSSVGAGIGNELSHNLHAYNNVILGSKMGLDIGCGSYNLISNNLITSYSHFNRLKKLSQYTAIDLSGYEAFSQSDINTFTNSSCIDGIALSGNYMSLVFDNEITDCTAKGDLILSYDHWIKGKRHNVDEERHIEYGHKGNLFFRNKVHDNQSYTTIREYNKQEDGRSHEELFFQNLFYNNRSVKGIVFEHSQGLLFINNTMVGGDHVSLSENSINAVIKNNLFFKSKLKVSSDSSIGVDSSNNITTSRDRIFADIDNRNYQLNTSIENACIGSGFNLNKMLVNKFEAYIEGNYSQDGSHNGFSLNLVIFRDLIGRKPAESWDIGAYVFHDMEGSRRGLKTFN